MGDALFQTPYAQASPCRLPERRLLPTLHKFIFVFQFYCFRSRRLSPEHRRCQGPRAFFISPPLSPIMGDALSQTPYAQATPCRLPERRLLPTLHKFIFCFSFLLFSLARVNPKITCGAWAFARFLFLPLCPPLWGMRSHRRPMRLPIPAVFPSVGSCRLCTNLFLFFNFTVFTRGSCLQSTGGAWKSASADADIGFPL